MGLNRLCGAYAVYWTQSSAAAYGLRFLVHLVLEEVKEGNCMHSTEKWDTSDI